MRAEEAPSWAAVGFGVDETLWELRILRGSFGCTEPGVSVARFAAHNTTCVPDFWPVEDGEAAIRVCLP